MKNALPLLLCSLFLASCTYDKASPESLGTCPILLDGRIPGEYTLCTSHDLTLQPGNLKISLTNLQDSRCPTGAMCLWQGEAKVELHLHRESQQATIQLGTQDREDYEPNTIENILGLKFVLLEVLPYPVLGEEEIKLEDYRVRIAVK